MSAAVYCQLCGQQFSGPMKSLRHKSWPRNLQLQVCPECYQHKPRCRLCDLPMAGLSPNGACVTCQETRKLCRACGQPARGRYFDFDGVGPYCTACMEKRKRCDICGAPLTDEYWELSDDRIVCAYCHATAVYTPAVAAELYEDIKAVIYQQLGIKLNIPTGLALVDRRQLSQVIQQQQEKEGNGSSTIVMDAQHTLGLYARRGIRRALYLQTGLPRMLFIQVAAHEYAHAWQGENCFLLQDEMKFEGFAEWIAYRLVGYYGYRQSQERMQARQDIYGQGLRWALDLEARHGIAAMLDICRNGGEWNATHG